MKNTSTIIFFICGCRLSTFLLTLVNIYLFQKWHSFVVFSINDWLENHSHANRVIEVIIHHAYIYSLIKILCKSKECKCPALHCLNIEAFFIKPVLLEVYELISTLLMIIYTGWRYWKSSSKWIVLMLMESFIEIYGK